MKQETECTIKEASEILNIPASTLRYWEELGLIRSRRLPDSNYRVYSLHALFEASNIAFYRKMGVSLKQLEAMKTRSLSDVVRAFDATTEKLEREIYHMQQVLKRLNYQRSLSQHALDLIQNGVRETMPIIVQLDAYDAESSWQRKMLVRDMQRYALFIEADNTAEMIEAYVTYPEGSEAEEDALSQESEQDLGFRKKASMKKPLQKAQVLKGQGQAGQAEHAVQPRKEIGSAVLWKREKELARGVVFFEGIAFSEYEEEVNVQVKPIFEEVRSKGYTPHYAIAHFLVSADFEGKKDCYRVLVGTTKN